jgi:hypothetical protein
MPINRIDYEADEHGRAKELTAKRSTKGCIEQFQINVTQSKSFPGFQGRHCDLGRAEQHRIDGVKVAFGVPENL